MSFSFDLFNLDMLKEIANIGAGNAATSLANLVGQKIDMDVPEVNIAEFKNLANVLNGAETLLAGILVKISGDINGLMMYLMDEESACQLVKILLNKDKKNFYEFEEMERSLLTEIGNILTSSYLTALSTLMNCKIEKSIPYLSIDMAGAILSVPAIQFSKIADKVLLIKSNFNKETKLSGYFMLIPDISQN